MIEEALDSVKSTRDQIGTFTHLSDDIDNFLEKLRVVSQKVSLFFADRSHAALVGAAIIFAILLVNYLRGWIAVRIQRRR